MPTFANISVLDGQPTPVAHVFSPESNSGLEANYAERTSGISLGYPKLKLNMQLAEKNKPLNKVRVRFSVPKLETISGSTTAGLTPAPRLAYVATFDGTFIFHERATKQERKDLRVLLANILANASVVEVIDDLAPVY